MNTLGRCAAESAGSVGQLVHYYRSAMTMFTNFLRNYIRFFKLADLTRDYVSELVQGTVIQMSIPN